MKTKRSLSPRTSPKLRQKLGLKYVAVGVALAVIVGVCIFFYLNIGTSDETLAAGADDYSVKSGFWSDDFTWNRGSAPPTDDLTADIEIFGYVTLVGDLSYGSGSNATLVITDTLVIEGNLSMGNKSNVTVNDGGVLIITGNFSAQNKILVGNGGVIAIGGDMIFPSNSNDTYSESGGSLYVLGNVSGNSTASDDAQIAPALQNNYPVIYSYLTGAVSTLPIKLAYFKATIQDDHVIMEWETDEEINNDFFSVERSTDGKGFETLAELPGAGNSSSRKQYHYKDTSPLASTSYYRLKQTDYDGKFEYSDIVSVTYQSQQAQDHHAVTIRTVGPNPFEDTFYAEFTLTSAGPVEVQLMNMQGQVAASEIIEGYTGDNRYDFSDRQGLATGMYLLRMVQRNTTSKAIRLIKR